MPNAYVGSVYKGVYSNTGGKTWKAVIRTNSSYPIITQAKNKKLPIGSFPTEQQAAHAYDVAMQLIFPDGPPEAPNVPELMTPEVLAALEGVTLDQKLQEWREAGAKPFAQGSSAYRGVCYHKGKKKWEAQINNPHTGKKECVLSVVDTVPDAQLQCARAYDGAALKYLGRKARLNFPASAYLNNDDPEIRAAAAAFIAATEGANAGAGPSTGPSGPQASHPTHHTINASASTNLVAPRTAPAALTGGSAPLSTPLPANSEQQHTADSDTDSSQLTDSDSGGDSEDDYGSEGSLLNTDEEEYWEFMCEQEGIVLPGDSTTTDEDEDEDVISDDSGEEYNYDDVMPIEEAEDPKAVPPDSMKIGNWWPPAVHEMLLREGYIDIHGKTLKNFPTFQNLPDGDKNTPLREGAVRSRECDFLPTVPGLEKMYWPHGHLAVSNRLAVVSSRRRRELEEELEQQLAAGRAALLGDDGRPCLERIRQAYHEQVPGFNERLAEIRDDPDLRDWFICNLASLRKLLKEPQVHIFSEAADTPSVDNAVADAPSEVMLAAAQLNGPLEEGTPEDRQRLAELTAKLQEVFARKSVPQKTLEAAAAAAAQTAMDMVQQQKQPAPALAPPPSTFPSESVMQPQAVAEEDHELAALMVAAEAEKAELAAWEASLQARAAALPARIEALDARLDTSAEEFVREHRIVEWNTKVALAVKHADWVVTENWLIDVLGYDWRSIVESSPHGQVFGPHRRPPDLVDPLAIYGVYDERHQSNGMPWPQVRSIAFEEAWARLGCGGEYLIDDDWRYSWPDTYETFCNTEHTGYDGTVVPPENLDQEDLDAMAAATAEIEAGNAVIFKAPKSRKRKSSRKERKKRKRKEEKEAAAAAAAAAAADSADPCEQTESGENASLPVAAP